MDSPSDGMVDSTASFVPPEAIELFHRIGSMVVALAISLFSFLFFRKFLFYLTWRSFRDGPYVIGYHQWRPGNVAGPHWCNICESIVYGIRSYVVTCDICGMFAHAQCAATTMKKRSPDTMPYACKQAATAPPRTIPLVRSSPQDSQSDMEDGGVPHSLPLIEERSVARTAQPHVWIKGNIDPMDTCSICGLFCGSILALSGLKCAWCHMRVHENCFKTSSSSFSRYHPLLKHCRLGRHAQLILPPSSVRVATSINTNTTTSQRALSTVRSAAQMAVTTMSNIRLRRPSSAIALIPSSTSSESKALTNSISPCSSPRQEKLPSTTTSSIKTTTTNITTTLPFEIINPKELTPLLVFINSRSGGQMGLHVLRHIRRYLNPLQIYDLSHQSPVTPLIQFQSIPRLRILVCGGDGTVAWVLSALDELGASRQPPIAILPLGTGNDLARVLGWGSGFSTTNVSDVLTEVENAHVSLLDRWKVEIDGEVRGVCNNYVGVGVDAQVALEFHQQRERSPSLFMSQFVNKLWYTRFGTKNFLVRTCAGLPSKIQLECDNQLITLPEGTEGVILLNINSYGGGSKLWHDDSEPDSDSSSEEDSESESETDEGMSSFSDSMSASSSPERRGRHSRERIGSGSGSGRRMGMGLGRSRCGSSSPHDGLLDVVAVYGTLHLGQMQVGLSKAVRLCQAKRIKIVLHETLPLQIDGEPWLQPPSQMDISFHTQAFMLSRTVQERDLITRRVGEVLDWAENTSVISSNQRDVLLAEIARRVADERGTGCSSGSGTICRREGNLSIVTN